jgi:hypothetical protein
LIISTAHWSTAGDAKRAEEIDIARLVDITAGSGTMTTKDRGNKVAIRDEHGRYLKGIPGGPGRPVGSRNKLSQDFLRDLQEDWEQHGKNILSIMREKFPEIYFQSMVKLAMIHRVEFGQPQEFERPRTREEVLQKMEERAGLAGRKMLERFLARVDKLERAPRSANFGPVMKL